MKVAQLFESDTPLVISMLLKLVSSGQPVDYYMFVSSGEYEEDGTPIGNVVKMGEIAEVEALPPPGIYIADMYVRPPGTSGGLPVDRYYIRREYLDNTFLKKFGARWRLYSGSFPAFPNERAPT